MKNKIKILEGSRAIAEAVALCQPEVISAFPITPQTHIVEDLAKLISENKLTAIYERAESETAAASIMLGASAAGVRAYTATSSQGLLHMIEVIYNMSGMRLPGVLTLANRAISAPINIWNDHSDAMAMRDAGWIMLFAENSQEAVDMHFWAFKIGEKVNIPVCVNVDGFSLTHTTEPVYLPSKQEAKGYLKKRVAGSNSLDTTAPISLGLLYGPDKYQDERLKLHNDLNQSKKVIESCAEDYYKQVDTQGLTNYNKKTNNAWWEYYGPQTAKTLIVVLGSTAGTFKTAIDLYNKKNRDQVALLKLKLFRPLPIEGLAKIINHKKHCLVIDRALALGANPPLYSDIKAIAKTSVNLTSVVTGLGGKDITVDLALKAIKLTRSKNKKIITL